MVRVLGVLIQSDRFKYDGVVLPQNPTLNFKLNLLKKLEDIKAEISKQRTLPLSMIGCINVVKIVSMPRFLYIFQNLPIFLTKAFFQNCRFSNSSLYLGVQSS